MIQNYITNCFFFQPILKEYRDFETTMKRVGDLGAIYESSYGLSIPDRPHKPNTTSNKCPSTAESKCPFALTLAVSGCSKFLHNDNEYFESLTTDSSPVQQQISEIFNCYSLLGTKMSDRRLELDSMRDECTKTDETFCSLATFLDKIERQMLRDSAVPQSRDDTDRQLRSVKNMMEDLNDRQPMLDSLESQVLKS